MINILKNLIKATKKRKGIFLILAYLALMLLSSLMISIVEPVGTPLTSFWTALWWSIVTSTTVGYGDVYPISAAGKILAVSLPMFFGIGLGAAFITYLASVLIERRDKKMYGEEKYSGENHIVLLGSTNDTIPLIDQILTDENRKLRDIVIVADFQKHPMPYKEDVFFVRGDPVTKETLHRANIEFADRVVIHTGKDENSLFALINTLEFKKESCEVTVECLSSQSLDTFTSVPGDFEVIMQMTAEMIVQAMQDKVHIPIQILLKNDENEEIYLIRVKDELNSTWWDLHLYLKEKYNYLTFAIKYDKEKILINPPRETPVSKGCSIWLIAEKRPVNINWKDL
ncbi:MAG: ion channel [Thermodesulfobacteriota bacterium]